MAGGKGGHGYEQSDGGDGGRLPGAAGGIGKASPTYTGAYGGGGGGAAGYGTIDGGRGGRGGDTGGAGGAGGTAAHIDGYSGKSSTTAGGGGGGGGFAAMLVDGDIIFTGAVTGGRGGDGGKGGFACGGGGGGEGGAGMAVLVSANIENDGTIMGGTGGTGGDAAVGGGYGGYGGTGLVFAGPSGTLVNRGIIQGGNGGNVLKYNASTGRPGAGVVGANLEIWNSGKISGGWFAGVEFTGGVNVVHILDGSVIEGWINGGGDDTVDYSAYSQNVRIVVDYDATATGGLISVEHVIGSKRVDLLSYRKADNGVDVDLGAGTATGFVSVKSFENAEGGRWHDKLTGSGKANVLTGRSGDDVLNGVGGADKLFGDAGADVLTGGRGVDILTGGTESDIFVFIDPADSGLGTRADKITDFSQAEGDQIDLSALGSLHFIGKAAFSGTAGEVRYRWDGAGHTDIRVDVDGDGLGDMSILVTGEITFVSADFVL